MIHSVFRNFHFLILTFKLLLHLYIVSIQFFDFAMLFLDHGLTQLLFDALVENNSFIPKHIHLLFHSKLDAIDLSRCAAFKLGDNILRTLLKRCKVATFHLFI